jgi:phage tail-like protein
MPDSGNSTPRKNPFGAFAFQVTLEIPGEGLAYPFRSCSGLRAETQVVPLEEGGFNNTTRKLIGRTNYPNIVLKRGLCAANTELYRIREQLLSDLPNSSGGSGWVTPNRFGGIITQLGPGGSFMKFRFSRGWICKWEGPELDASKNEISIETIEIAHEGLALVGTKEPSG